MRDAFTIGGQDVAAGHRALVDLPVARLSNHTPVTLPVHIVHGRRSGPVLFVSAAIHGDEILGIEIIRRLLTAKALNRLSGTLMCVPIVNAFGFISQTRYLPDRRDLNRSFPGSETGSLAGQLAHIFLNEVVRRADLGIDLHTGAINRSNLPQLRGDFSQEELRKYAEVFGAPVVLQANLREGSLRQSARNMGVEVLLYEAGEALRLDEAAIRIGVKGILNVLHQHGMLGKRANSPTRMKPVFSRASRWVRAPIGGLFSANKTLGDAVAAGDIIGKLTNPYEGTIDEVTANIAGIIIGRTNISVVNRADALFHIAEVVGPEAAEERIGQITEELHGDPIFDEDEVV